MAAKPSFRRPLSVSRRPSPRSARGRFGIAALAALTAVLAFGASSALASTGSVYFDSANNAAAGDGLFNGTFTGTSNVGLGRFVMTGLTSGSNNGRRRLRVT